MVEFRRCGQDGLLAEFRELSEVDAARALLTAAAERGALPELAELLPGARTLLAVVQPGSRGLDTIRELLSEADLTDPPARDSRELTLAVRYDGPDLELVARTAGVSTSEVVALHADSLYTVAFCGFAPGFGYLSGLHPLLQQPRLESPRTSVPAGAVGVAGEFSAIYPGSSPGGWRLIGSCAAPLFDPRREPPALLSPGDRVRFEVVR
ncbi:KipI family sensor histidine kinase inhibitor [Tamaricihabitans halophyticus]|uniref:KipI family sensor histidine kinase inhibitor n=1 Tax=Tamaricihabitans halophyticus TaxID=1262583 RepID=A0A4R2R4Q3_9PSEU|nr:allophanate hydrolase subunit 1 [Tamaricihabitans halophyticus]TCP54355.1 KipI family sensor histidine kinase inhibitor [Tamaricihabitans halophyticus]